MQVTHSGRVLTVPGPRLRELRCNDKAATEALYLQGVRDAIDAIEAGKGARLERDLMGKERHEEDTRPTLQGKR